MFRTLNAELGRRGIKKGDLAKALNITATTLSNKLSGKNQLTLEEALKIKAILQVDMTVEVLFAKTA